MKRFFEMMPSNEIEREEEFLSESGIIIIQAGPKGWAILWADDSSTYKNIDASTENNFNEAYNKAIKNIGELIKLENEENEEFDMY